MQHGFPLLGMATLKAVVGGRGSELLGAGVSDPEAVMNAVIEGCSLMPFVDLLCGPVVDDCKVLLVDALDATTAMQVRGALQGGLSVRASSQTQPLCCAGAPLGQQRKRVRGSGTSAGAADAGEEAIL